MIKPIKSHLTSSDETLLYTVSESAAGRLLLAISCRGIVALAFLDEKSEMAALQDLRQNLGHATFQRDDRALAPATRAVRNFLAIGDAARDEIVLDLRGSDFQQRVWKELMRLPRGTTATYSDIARRIGNPSAIRAVASAIGDNPVSLFVPCHRVLRKDGSLGGYRWGLDAKRRLNAIESDSAAISTSKQSRTRAAA